MNNHKREISGIKENKNIGFFGHISLLLDEIRIKAIRKDTNNASFNEFRNKRVMRIKNDDKKIEAALLIGLKVYEIVDVFCSLKSDDKKLEVLKYIEDEEYRVIVAESIKDNSKRIIALNSFKDENIIGRLARNIIGLEKFDNSRGLGELIKVAKTKKENNQLIEGVYEQIEQFEKIKSIVDDEEKMTAIKQIECEYLKAELAKTLIEEENKIKIIDLISNEMNKAIIAVDLENEEEKIRIIKNFKERDAILTVVDTMQDHNKIKYINLLKENLEDESLISDVIMRIQDDSKKIELLTIVENNNEKFNIIRTIKDDDEKIKLLSSFPYGYRVRGVTLIKDKNKKIDYIIENGNYEKIEDFYYRYCDEDEYKSNSKFKELKLLLKRINQIKNARNEDEIIEFISGINNIRLKVDIIKKITNEDKKMGALETLTPEQLKSYRNYSEDIDFVKNNIAKFIEAEGFGDVLQEDIIDELYQKNNNVVLNIDFRLLNEKYMTLLGKDKINLISCYPQIQEELLSLEDNECYVFSKCIDSYVTERETDEWTVVASEMLSNMKKGEYDELIQSIPNLEDLTEEDFGILIRILQNNNFFDITNIEQIKEFEEIRRKKCNEIIQDDNASIYEKKEVLIQKIFGHDFTYAKGIIEKFGEDIKGIDDEDLKYYVETLKLIDGINDEEVLKKIFDESEFVQGDKATLERMLKNEFGKLLSEGLYKPTEKDLIDEELNIYEAGTDFRIIMTAIGAFNNRDIQNYKDDWNRPAISTQHFCASYIRNDMIGTAPISSICYGFSDITPDSLMLCGNNDVGSSANTFISTADRSEKYYTPEGLINNTEKYNEIDLRRIQGDGRKQPDYIIVFRENGKIPNMKEAQMASKQWGGLPIVIIDKDRCLEAERTKVEQMIQEYKQNPNPALERLIRQKIRNNRVTNQAFCYDIDETLSITEDSIDVDNLNKKTKLMVTEKDLMDNYELTNGTERKVVLDKIKTIFKRTKEIIRGEVDGK